MEADCRPRQCEQVGRIPHLVVGKKAIIHVAVQHSGAFDRDLSSALPHNEAEPPLTGYVLCPRGCGTRILWALSADLAEFKEALLVYLNQQLSWSPCPDHQLIQSQCGWGFQDELDWAYLPSPDSVFGRGPRYVNCYE